MIVKITLVSTKTPKEIRDAMVHHTEYVGFASESPVPGHSFVVIYGDKDDAKVLRTSTVQSVKTDMEYHGTQDAWIVKTQNSTYKVEELEAVKVTE